MTPKEEKTEYWFKPRRYGHGASSTAWQGWATIVAFPVICAAVTLALFALLPPAVAMILFAIFMIAAIFGFIAFVRNKTEGEWRWSWGDRP
jgi:predicted membrane metal-binding protein